MWRWRPLKLTFPLTLYLHKFTDGESNGVIEVKQFSCRRTCGGSSAAVVAKLPQTWHCFNYM
jgi:hypothetical protein